MFRHRSLLASGLAVVALVVGVVESCPGKCDVIRAAYYYFPYQNFIIGDRVYQIEHGQVKDIFAIKYFDVEHPITAAFGIDNWGQFYIISDKGGQQEFQDYGLPAPYKLNDYMAILAKFQVDVDTFKGMDAASLGPNGYIHYFYGCHYVMVDPEDEQNMSDLKYNGDVGLPCDVDAALFWPDLETTVVIKGDHAFAYDQSSERFADPVPLSDLKSPLQNLCPYNAQED